MKKEVIVCAAIKVEGAGSKWDDIYKGPRHHHCFSQMSRIRQKFTNDDRVRVKMLQNSTQGFITSKDRFVNREEAYLIASSAGQIKYNLNQKRELFSEHLY